MRTGILTSSPGSRSTRFEPPARPPRPPRPARVVAACRAAAILRRLNALRWVDRAALWTDERLLVAEEVSSIDRTVSRGGGGKGSHGLEGFAGTVPLPPCPLPRACCCPCRHGRLFLVSAAWPRSCDRQDFIDERPEVPADRAVRVELSESGSNAEEAARFTAEAAAVAAEAAFATAEAAVAFADRAKAEAAVAAADVASAAADVTPAATVAAAFVAAFAAADVASAATVAAALAAAEVALAAAAVAPDATLAEAAARSDASVCCGTCRERGTGSEG